MEFSDAIEKFKSVNERSEIPYRDPERDGTRSLDDSSVRGHISAVRRALHRATNCASVDHVELEPHAEALPEHARRYAEEQGRSGPRQYKSRVRLFLRVVEGKVYQQRPQSRDGMPEEWTPLYDALERHLEREPANWGARSAFGRLQVLASVHQIDSPRQLPPREQLEAWAREDEDGISMRYFRRMLEAYRMARKELGDDSLPVLKSNVRRIERGLRSLENLPELLAEAGHPTDDPYQLQGREILQWVAPKFAKAAAKYVQESSGDSHSLEKKAFNAASRAAAEAIRLRHDTSDMHVHELFLPVLERTEKVESWLTDVAGGEESTETVSLLDLMLDGWATQSWENSALKVESGKDDFVYTHTIQNDLYHLSTMVEVTHFKHLDEDEVDNIEEEVSRLWSRIKDHNEDHVTSGQKDKEKMLRTITWPQLVCIGLPALRDHVYELRHRYFALVERHDGDLSSRGIHDARTRYFSALEKYLATAIVADDGLRVQNYSGARMGRHIKVDPETKETVDGIEWTGLKRVVTHFFGHDAPHVRLKNDTDENQRSRDRRRELNPNIVDFDLLQDYLLDYRPYALSQAGLIGPDDEDEDESASDEETRAEEFFDPRMDDDRYALFVSRRSNLRDGRYRKDGFSEKVGKTLLWIAGNVLGRDVPEWESKDRTTAWRELWVGHTIRLLIGTYWGGIRGKWTYAERLTDDTRRTLEKAYDRAASGAMQDKIKRDGWENPHHFDDVCDRLKEGKDVDWDRVRDKYDMPSGR